MSSLFSIPKKKLKTLVEIYFVYTTYVNKREGGYGRYWNLGVTALLRGFQSSHLV